MENNPTFKFCLRDDLKDQKQFLPTRATPVATGWDVRVATEDKKSIVLRPGQMVKIPLGFRMQAPENWWLLLAPRSSTFAKKSLHCLYGVLDQDWRGYSMLACQYIPDISCMGKDLVLDFGEPIGQLIPFELKHMNVVEVESTDEFNNLVEQEHLNVRKDKGFGSTG